MKRNNLLSRRFVFTSLSLCFLVLIAAAANTIAHAANLPSLSEITASPKSETRTTATPGEADGLQFTLETPSPLITKDSEYCASNLNKTVDKVTFSLTGTKEASFTGIAQGSAGSIKYCFKLRVNDFPDGAYKLTAKAQRQKEVATETAYLIIGKQEEDMLDRVAQSATAFLEDKCAKIGAENLDECKDKIISEYAENVGCTGMTKEECAVEIKKEYADALIAARDKYARIKEKAEQYFGKDITISDLEKALNDGLANPDASIPLQEKSIRVKALRIAESILIDKEGGMIQSAPIAVAIDTDGDGMPDDIEKRLGTSPDEADTDGDGYKDTEEILAGYNPLGPGKKTTELSPIEKAILENSMLEQPKGSGEEKESFTVDKVENATAGTGNSDGNGYVISGKAEPNNVATLYIYSDIPIVATVTTDEYGNWEYRFDEPLSDGDHEIYVTLNDNTGKVVGKSKPFGFPVQEAKAATPADLANISQNASPKLNNIFYYYALASILIVLGIFAFLFTIIKIRQKNKLNQQ